MWCGEVLSSLLVKRCNAALRGGKIEVRLAVVLTQRCFLCAFALWCNELLTIEKGDFQRTDGINMKFLWHQSYHFILTFWDFSGLNTSIWLL